MDNEAIDTVEAFKPDSPYWGSMLCPAAKVLTADESERWPFVGFAMSVVDGEQLESG